MVVFIDRRDRRMDADPFTSSLRGRCQKSITDGPADRPMDPRTDKRFYKDEATHLKSALDSDELSLTRSVTADTDRLTDGRKNRRVTRWAEGRTEVRTEGRTEIRTNSIHITVIRSEKKNTKTNHSDSFLSLPSPPCSGGRFQLG